MQVHLLDGTYELFRHYAVVPEHRVGGRDMGAARAVCRSVLGLLEDDVSHLGVATDHVIESFRNAMWPGYKTGEGLPERLAAQFGPLETSLAALGVVVWPMAEVEADDALASAAAAAARDASVARVVILSPDKDLAQCVDGGRVVTCDRRTGVVRDAVGVVEHFGVPPASIPDLLALVGDSADGFPGLAGWGAKSAATVLARYGSIERIPPDPGDWDVSVRGAERLARHLAEGQDAARLFKRLATLRTDVDVLPGGVEGLRWRGPAAGAAEALSAIDAPDLLERAARLAAHGPPGEATATRP